MQLFHRHPLPSIRSKLFILILACALPVLIGYFAFARDAARREREHVAQDALTVAQALSAAVDRDLASSETAARVLANSPALAAGDLARFHEHARKLLRPDFPAHAFVLSGPDGRQLLNTRYPFGAALPADGDAANIRRVFASGDPVTSGLHQADPSQPFVVSIDVPVWVDGKVGYALSVQLRPKRIAELLAAQHLPEGWIAEVYDNRRQMVARNLDLVRNIGRGMPAALGASLAGGSGSGIVPAREDAPQYAYARSRAQGWTVSVGFPPGAARDLLGHSSAAILATVALMLAITLALAWVIGGSIARAVRALTEPAAALGRGEPLAIPRLRLREAAAVADALRQVEGELVGYRTRLEALVAERTAEVARSNAMLETVYASAPVGLCFMDRELRFVMVNDYLAALNAVPAADHIGRTLPEVLGPAGREFEQGYRRALDTGRPLVDVESSGEVPQAPGVTRHWIASYYPVYGPDREIAGINAVVLDITERRLQEQRARDHQELFRALYERSGDAHMLLAVGAGFVSANRATARLFGYDTIEALLAMSPASASPECQPCGGRSDQLALEHMRRTLDSGGAHFEWLHRRRDGSTFHADVMLTSVDIGGKGMIQATIRDISSRVAAETALRATGERLVQRERFIRTVTDHLPALVGYWDAGMRCQFANKPYLQWLGRSEAEAIGQDAEALLGAQQMAVVRPHVEAALAGKAQGFARELRKEDGEIIHAWASYIPDVDEQGAVRGFYMLHADISDLKRTEARLVQALREAEQASRAKGEFLANMSHEIRTPMNAILGLARLLGEAPLARRELGYVARMQSAARSLLGMLNDVLDFSRAESGQLALEHTPFRLDDVLDNVAVLAAANAWNKGIEPVFAVAPDVPAFLVGDPMRLEQVLLNLAGNAVKFTEQGEVLLAVRVHKRAGARVQLSFAVRDTGIGIAPEQQERMFEAFSQGDSSTGRKYGGAGLGLAIARRLVGLMGGALRVSSQPGRGAEFSFEIGFEAGPGQASPLPGPAAALSVLVADDNRAACAAVADACAAFGWQVDRAHGGAEALALLRGARRYDLAFIDSAMPGLDGVSVLSQARADRSIVLPRCALLAADPERAPLAELARELGIDAILPKPVTPRALLAAIAELRGGPVAQAPAAAAPLAGRLRGLRVLLVEDNLINQEVASYILVHAGAALDIAGNGQVAVSMLADGAQYDVVLMDLQMPVMNGFDATAAIRAMGLAALPIVAMSANAMEEDRRRALAAGMDAHLPKPIDVDELVDTLVRITGHVAPLDGEPGAAPAAAPAPASLPGIDLKATLPRFGGSFASFAAVFRRLESSQGGTLDEVRALLRAGDRQGARQLAHRLRGVAANLGATEVAAQALEFEQALHGADDAALALRLARLDSALQLVLEAARELEAVAAAPAPQPAPAGAHACGAPRAALARLLELLANNNMKAMAQFEPLRAALAQQAPAEAAELSEAIATLHFDTAARLVRGLLDREEYA